MAWSMGLGSDQPRLQGNLLCRKDWIQLREIARSEWGAVLPIQEVAAYPPRRAGPSGLTSAGRHGIGAQARSMALVQDVWTASATQKQNTGSGTSARLGATAGECSNIRFRHSPSCRSSQSSLCKSSRLSHGGPLGDVTSLNATLHSGIHFASCSVELLLARSILGSGTSSSDPPMSSAAKPWEVDAFERSRRARRLPVQVALNVIESVFDSRS